MKVEIYSKDNCGFCDMAIRMAEANNLEFTVKKLDEDFTREELMESVPTARSFPVVIIDGEYIGGFKEFNNIVVAQKN